MEDISEAIERGLLVRSVQDLDLRKNTGLFIKVAILSETKSFFICRNNEPTETTAETFHNYDRVVVPGPKWRGAERATALTMFRWADAINQEYNRNAVTRKILLKNPVSLIYGDSSTGSEREAASIASRCYYDWSYSYEPLGAVTERFIHNSLSDTGTILMDKEGKVQRNAIYNVQYIKPGVKFVRFISLENASLDILKVVIAATIRTTRYGARTSILGDNMQNTILAIGFSKGDRSITSYSVMEEAWNSDSWEPEKLIIEQMKSSYGNDFLTGNALESFLNEVKSLSSNREEMRTLSSQFVSKMEQDWSDFWKV
ncbi:type I-D CRISPR-associated protein Cas7/Csc2 [Thermoplasma sp. Kam2015]|uniref:type I-D CRISPR-associated protein Cas7/Csc2 n=1 Tax=Thermoplasma sp. Kam2015 TaxID=2094122 RepID=UPI001293F105|nr:type I-D CRISPR-associated protein Cas7/Csc2 [Thermoplasma sp. Kam2015]